MFKCLAFAQQSAQVTPPLLVATRWPGLVFLLWDARAFFSAHLQMAILLLIQLSTGWQMPLPGQQLTLLELRGTTVSMVMHWKMQSSVKSTSPMFSSNPAEPFTTCTLLEDFSWFSPTGTWDSELALCTPRPTAAELTNVKKEQPHIGTLVVKIVKLVLKYLEIKVINNCYCALSCISYLAQVGWEAHPPTKKKSNHGSCWNYTVKKYLLQLIHGLAAVTNGQVYFRNVARTDLGLETSSNSPKINLVFQEKDQKFKHTVKLPPDWTRRKEEGSEQMEAFSGEDLKCRHLWHESKCYSIERYLGMSVENMTKHQSVSIICW